MATSMISTQLNNFWKTAIKVDLEHRINATLLRKMAVTKVHENQPTLKQPLANLMNHDVNTVRKEYFLVEKKKAVVETSAKLRNIIRTSGSKFDSPDLNSIFSCEIEKKGSITIDDVRNYVELYPALSKWKGKQLLDKVRYIIKNKKKKEDDEEEKVEYDEEEEKVEEEEKEDTEYKEVVEESGDEERDEIKRERKVFSGINLKLIRSKCKHIIQSTCPMKAQELQTLFENDSVLKQLLNKFGLAH